MKLTRYLVLVCLLCPIFAYAQRPLTIVGGVVTANVADTNDFQVTLTANVTGVTLVSTTGSANTPVTPATGYQITMRFVQDATGSRTVVFGGSISTSCSVNSTANSVTICRWQYTASTNLWTDSGGSSVSPNSPIPANQAQGPTYNVLNYAGGLTINDAQHIRDGVTAGGATKTVTSATANFQTTDVGKFIACVYASGAQSVTVGTTITARNSATSVSISANDNGAGNTESCVWYSNKADTAIRAAILAATPTNTASGDPNNKPTLGNSGTAYCPAGGYAVTVNAVAGALLTFAGTGSSIGPNFIGEGKTKCNIYPLADSTDPGGPTLINLFNSSHSVIGGFSIDGLGFAFPFTHPIVGLTSVQNARIYDVEITNISANMSNLGTIDFTNSTMILGENIFVQGASTGKNDFACGFGGTSSSHFKNLTCSNHNQTAFFGSGGGVLRGVAGDNGVVIENATFDECGSATNDCTIFVAGYANFYGGWIGVGNSNRSAMNVDATSRVWISNINCGQFGSTNVVSNCMTIASGGEVNATMSDLRGNGSGANGVVVTGPAGAKFFDMGGNKYRNCVSAVCTDVSLANWTTMGFTGGITPIFPLATNATTQLGARQTVTGIAPTFAVTGFGTGPTITVQTGSTDAAGAVTITAGTTPGSSGTFTLTFTTGNGAYGTNPPVCIFGLVNGTGSWNALAQEPIVQTPTTTSVIANWADNSVALTATSTYGFVWSCYGK